MDIKKQLQKGGIKFTIKDITTYRSDGNGNYNDLPKIFEVDKNGGSIWSEFNGMNVTKWGPTCVTLYTFDMLGRKSVGKINYKEVKINN